MGLYSGQKLVKDWYIYTLWVTMRDYWLNAKTSVSKWQTLRDSDVGKFVTGFKLAQKLK